LGRTAFGGMQADPDRFKQETDAEVPAAMSGTGAAN
jgi:hypothetical protein